MPDTSRYDKSGDEPEIVYQGSRLGWKDERNPLKWMTVKLDPYRERAAVEIRINHGGTFIATPAACREVAERLLVLARVAENLEPRDGELRRVHAR